MSFFYAYRTMDLTRTMKLAHWSWLLFHFTIQIPDSGYSCSSVKFIIVKLKSRNGTSQSYQLIFIIFLFLIVTIYDGSLKKIHKIYCPKIRFANSKNSAINKHVYQSQISITFNEREWKDNHELAANRVLPTPLAKWKKSLAHGKHNEQSNASAYRR